MHRMLHLLLLMAVLCAALPAMPAQAAQPSTIRVTHGPCAHGTRVSITTTCLFGSVFNSKGESLDNQKITIDWKDRDGRAHQQFAQTERRPTDGENEYGYMAILESTAVPGKTVVTLTTYIDGKAAKSKVLLMPNPVTVSQRIDLALATSTQTILFGQVLSLGGEPIKDAAITLSYAGANGQQEAQPKTGTLFKGVNTSFYSFDMKKLGVRSGSEVVLNVTISDPEPRTLRTTVQWIGSSMMVDIYPEWTCGVVIPKSDPTTLPERFCLSGTITDGQTGKPYTSEPPATVVVSVGAQTLVVEANTEGAVPGIYALDIGQLITSRPNSEIVRIVAFGERGSATIERTIGELRNPSGSATAEPEATYRFNPTLLPEWMKARVDKPFSAAVAGVSVLARATSPDGMLEGAIVAGSGVWLRTASGEWAPPSALQPCREGTALELDASFIRCQSQQGLFESRDSGNTWAMLPTEPPLVAQPGELAGEPYGLPSVRAFFISDTTALAAVENTVLRSNNKWEFEQLGELKDGPVKAVAMCGNSPVALTNRGVYTFSEDSKSWSPLAVSASGALNGFALAVVGGNLFVGRTTSREQVLVGENCGNTGLRPATLPTNAPMVAFADAGESGVLVGTDGGGVYKSSDNGSTWQSFIGTPARVSAMTVLEGNPCQLFVASGKNVQAFDCSNGAALPVLLGLPGRATQLAATRTAGGVQHLFAVGSFGVAESVNNGPWLVKGDSAGPIRGLAVAIPSSFTQNNQILVGGLGTGVLYYNNSAPDLRVELASETVALRPDETITLTAMVENMGSAPARNISIEFPTTGLTPEGTAPSWPASLNPGQKVTQTIAFRRSGDAPSITISSPLGNDLNTSNNTATYGLQALPAKAIDLAAVLAWDTRPTETMQPDGTFKLEKGKITVACFNLGELDEPAAKLSVSVESSTPGVTVSGLKAQIGALGAGKPCAKQTLSVGLPQNLRAGSTITLRASITGAGGDREPVNNTYTLSYKVGEPPQVVYVVNRSRMGSEAQQVMDELGEVAKKTNGEIIDVSAVAGWSDLSAKLQRLQNSTLEVPPPSLLQAADKAAASMTQNILNAIRSQLKGVEGKPYIVLVGGDDMIPYGRIAESVNDPSFRIKESQYAPNVPRSMPLYSTLALDYYPSDAVYGNLDASSRMSDPTVLKKLYQVSRLVGTPEQIASTLSLYGLPLSVTQSGLIGEVPESTNGRFNKTCANLPGWECQKKPLLEALPYRLDQAIFNGHGSAYEVGGLTARQALQYMKPSTPFAMTVSCHAGLALPENSEKQLSYPIAFSGEASGIYVASLPYAYSMNSASDYNERIGELMQELLASEPTANWEVGALIAEAKQQYIAENQGHLTALDWKVVYGLALYGLPTTELMVPSTVAARNGTATASTTLQPLQESNGLYTQEVTLPLSPSIDGRVAEYGAGTSQGARTSDGGTAQPYWQQVFEPVTTADGQRLVPKGVLFEGASYQDNGSFAALPVRTLPISADLPELNEAEITVRGWEDGKIATGAPFSDEKLLARIWLGQFYQGDTNFQRLLSEPSVRVIYAPASADTTPAKTETIMCKRPSLDRYDVTVLKRDGAKQAFVSYTTGDGRWYTEKMLERKNYWAFHLPYSANIQLFTQVIDAAGNVSTQFKDANNSYFEQTNEACPAWLGE